MPKFRQNPDLSQILFINECIIVCREFIRFILTSRNVDQQLQVYSINLLLNEINGFIQAENEEEFENPDEESLLNFNENSIAPPLNEGIEVENEMDQIYDLLGQEEENE